MPTSYIPSPIIIADFSVSSSYAETASYFSGSISNAVSASYAETASYALNGGGGGSTDTSSLLTTASFSNPNLTFTKGNGNTFNVPLTTLVATSSSYASTASYVTTAQTASYVLTAKTASYYGGSVTSSSYASTASYVTLAQTASYVLLAQTASYVQNSQTASYVLQAVSSSFATTAVSSSYSLSGSYAISASYARSASYSSYAFQSTLATTASYLSGVIEASSFYLGTSGYFISYQANASPGGTTPIYSIPTGSYRGTFFDYTVDDGTSNARAGTIMIIIFNNTVKYTETTTMDIGDTSDITWDVVISGPDAIIQATTSMLSWNVRYILRSV